MTSRNGTDPDKPVLVLFRHDLRIADNGALAAAASSGKPLVAAFVLDEASGGIRPLGGARRWWLHHSLDALARDLRQLGVTLILRRGGMKAVALGLCRHSGADLVLWNRRYDPPAAAADGEMASALVAAGIASGDFDGQLLYDPAELRTGQGSSYRVYTPFWRALKERAEPRDPIDAPRRLRPHDGRLESETLGDWGLLPKWPDWAGGLREEWTPGENGAQERLRRFLEGPVSDYERGRNLPGEDATSRLPS